MNNSMNIMNNSCLLVDLSTLRENVDHIASTLPEGCALIPVLKDDAYGLGLERVAAVLEEHDRVRMAAVAHVSEGLILRGTGFGKDILVMGSPLPFQIEAAVLSGLTLAMGSMEAFRMISDVAAALGLKARVHIKIDTGLHRIGFAPGKEVDELITALSDCKDIEVTGAFSHFSNAEDAESCAGQFELFTAEAEKLEKAGVNLPVKHICCSAASERYPGYALDAVRIGRRLYMDRPMGGDGGIRELASWRGYVTAVKKRKAGESIGYGGKCVLERDSLIATLGVGYGDGLQSALCDIHAPVLINGQRCPLMACCMDQSFADVSGLDCKVGDEVCFFGYDSAGNYLSSQEVALLIGGDEGCGLTSALSARVARVYCE